jgi:hypothetical protein
MTPIAALALLAAALVSARCSARSAGRCWVEAKHASLLARLAAMLATVHAGTAVAFAVPAGVVLALLAHGVGGVSSTDAESAFGAIGWMSAFGAAAGATLSLVLRAWASNFRDASVGNLADAEWAAMAAEHSGYRHAPASSWSLSGLDLGDLGSLDDAFPAVLAVLVCGGLLVAFGVWYARSTVKALAGTVPLPRRVR